MPEIPGQAQRMTEDDPSPGRSRGTELASVMSARLRSDLEPLPTVEAPVGPYFSYAAATSLFSGRTGVGPLVVVWDTNVLIDYFHHGAGLWAGEALPRSVPAEYGEELEALQLIVALWVLRDIRFVISPSAIQDAKGQLSATRVADRQHAFRAFTAALSLAPSGYPTASDGDRRDAGGTRRRTAAVDEDGLRQALAGLPAGFDRALVEEAARSDAHVFLTRDNGVLRSGTDMQAVGLLLASPGDLIEQLAASGSLHCMIEPRYGLWMTPDLRRAEHLFRALPARAVRPPAS